MIEFTILLRGAPGDRQTIEVEAPVLPRVGEYISHNQSGISGTVHSVQYWWDENGEFQGVEVAVTGYGVDTP